MKHTLEKTSDTHVSLTVTLEADELKSAKQLALKYLAPKVKVAGFRPGKVPADVAEKNLDPATLATETAEYAINNAINEIAEKEDLRILDRPSVDIKEYDPYESMEFRAEMEVLPEVTLGDYKKLKSKKEKVTVSADDINEVIDRMRSGMAEKTGVDRAAKDGDEVTIDFEGRDEKGELVEGASGKDYPLKLGSNTFIPGFEEGIVGHKVGEEFDLPLTFPKDYHVETLKGAKVTFKTTIKQVTEIKLPEVNDEFAAKCGPFKTADELKADVKRELTEQKEREAEEKLKDDMVGELVAASKVPAPELLVNDQMKSIEQDAQQNLMYRGMTNEQYMTSKGYKDMDEWREKEFREAAERRVKAGLTLAELSKKEKIEVSREELNSRLSEMLEQYPTMKDQLDTPESRRDIANRLLTEKTVQRLLEINSN